jgi:hypothetical protein
MFFLLLVQKNPSTSLAAAGQDPGRAERLKIFLLFFIDLKKGTLTTTFSFENNTLVL